MSISTDLAKEWAEKKASSEAKAFELAIRSTAIRKNDFSIDDEYEQAFRQGFHEGFKKAAGKMQSIIAENDELRLQLREQDAMINRLRECIARSSEEFYD